ncbi:MAG: hypothetical protein H6574_24470 [Lewinellaceae bacterium]|nr:hypothetical protein [Lewinellaceae bacterium]
MQSNVKIYAFFIILALLFWNPLSFYLFYHNTDAYSHFSLHGLFWLIPVVGMLLIAGIRKNKFGAKANNLILSLVFLGISFGFIVFLNAVAGLFVKSDKSLAAKGIPEKGLVFEPNSVARYTCAEFDYTAKINSIGLRDHEIDLDKGDKYRVLCFGDSWTFGWGVQLENSWPKQMETYLHQRGLTNIEVINAGQGNQYTTTYKEYIEKAVPVLKPDLVLVGVLELDDLAQLFENHYGAENADEERSKGTASAQLRSCIKDFFKASLRNYIKIFKANRNKHVDVGSNWKETSLKKIAEFDKMESLRFQMLDDSVQALFRSGDLNAGLLGIYVSFPDRVATFNDPENPATKFSAAKMHEDFEVMKQVCDQNHAQLVFANMPINYFNGHKVIRTPLDYLNPYFEQHNKVDSIYSAIAQANKLPYIELTEKFKALEPKDSYYFIYDGHPNKKGYHEIATYIGDQLLQLGILKIQ